MRAKRMAWQTLLTAASLAAALACSPAAPSSVVPPTDDAGSASAEDASAQPAPVAAQESDAAPAPADATAASHDAAQNAPPPSADASSDTTTAPPPAADATTGAPTTDAAAPVADAGPAGPLNLLVFSKTAGFRHASIPDGIAALQKMATAQGWMLTASEDATLFQDATLAPLDVIIFLSTTGDILDSDQQGALQRYVEAGKGWVGIHSASDTFHDWPWYGGLVGTYFRDHPDVQQASIHIENTTFPADKGLPNPWVRTDEWYAFTSNPRPQVNVLLTLDESSYNPGDASMGSDHPIAWYHLYDGGRSFYTALGHTSQSYSEPLFLAHLQAGIVWAGGR